MIKCMLCKGTHLRGECPEAGKLTSAVATCTVCRAYFRSSNTAPIKTMHLFTRAGYAERDMFPYIMKTTRSRRGAFLSQHGIRAIYLIDKNHLPKKCPSLENSQTSSVQSLHATTGRPLVQIQLNTWVFHQTKQIQEWKEPLKQESRSHTST